MLEFITLVAFVIMLIIFKKLYIVNRLQKSKYFQIFLALGMLLLIAYNVYYGGNDLYNHLKIGILAIAFIIGLSSLLKNYKLGK